MDYCTNHQPKYMNRAERRKNKIKTEKVTECKYTREELKEFLEKELRDLRNGSYSEIIRRERYERLRNLMEKYERQNVTNKTNSSKVKVANSLENSQDERVKAYIRGQQELASNKAYQNLRRTAQPNKKEQKVSAQAGTNYTMKKAISAYQTQTTYAKNNVVRKAQVASISTAKSTGKVVKKTVQKGFFSKILDLFKPNSSKKVQAKPKISSVKTIQKSVRYYHKATNQISKITNDVYHEFEKAMEDMRNYSKEINYKIYKNGREIKCKERYI